MQDCQRDQSTPKSKYNCRTRYHSCSHLFRVLQEFRSLRWLPTQPNHLDYVNAQILMVGESSGIEKALETQKEDRQKGVEEPAEEMEKLEEEDLERMKGLSKDDSTRIFSDLEANAKDYPKLQTTF